MMKRYCLSILPFCCLLVLASCGKPTPSRNRINNPDNGYIREVKTDAYTLEVQYQPPEYRAEQEIFVNKSSVPKEELVAEYDALQQFLVKYKWASLSDNQEYADLTSSFTLKAGETELPCIEAHQLTYSPGAPYHEIILLFPLSTAELGKSFILHINNFPAEGVQHKIEFLLKK